MSPFSVDPARGAKLDILIVEDNESDVALTLHALKKKRFDDVVVVNDGEEAIHYVEGTGKYADRRIPRIVLLDLKIPKVDGFGVLRVIRSNPEFHAVPVIVLSSSGEEQDVLQGYDLGANSYVVKPINFDAYINTIMQTVMYWLLTNRGI